jgi:hypothetical protein
MHAFFKIILTSAAYIVNTSIKSVVMTFSNLQLGKSISLKRRYLSFRLGRMLTGCWNVFTTLVFCSRVPLTIFSQL